MTRTDANAVANMAPISFAAIEAIALNGSSGGSSVFVGSIGGGHLRDDPGHPLTADVFAVGFAANTDTILGPVSFFGQAADNDFGYYYDYFGSSPRTTTSASIRCCPSVLLVERAGVASVTFNELSQVIFYSPLVGGSTVNIQGVPAQMLLNMGAAMATP